MMKKYLKKHGVLPDSPENLVAFARNNGANIRFVDARATMRLTGIQSLGEEVAREQQNDKKKQQQQQHATTSPVKKATPRDLDDDDDDEAAAHRLETQAPKAAASPIRRQLSAGAAAKKVALKRWLARHGFVQADGLDVLDAVDIREIADFEFVELEDLEQGGMETSVAQRLLDTFKTHGTDAPLADDEEQAGAIDGA